MTIYRLIGLDFPIEFRVSLGLALALALEIPTVSLRDSSSSSSSGVARPFHSAPSRSEALSFRKALSFSDQNKTSLRAAPSHRVTNEQSEGKQFLFEYIKLHLALDSCIAIIIPIE